MKFASIAAFITLALAGAAAAQSTAFTYQGQLKDGSAPAAGVHDIRFTLFNSAANGVVVGTPQCVNNVMVTDGVFTAPLDFGQVFTLPGNLFLQIEVRADTGLDCGDITGFTALSPRQPVTSAPIASHARTAYMLSAADGSPANAVFVDNSGNVGIANALPSAKLDIQGADNSNVLIVRRSGGSPAHNLYVDSGGNGSLQLLDVFGSVRVNFGSGNTSFLNYGRVGIGTAAPGALLDVRGDIRMGSQGQFQATASTEAVRIVRGTVSSGGSLLRGAGFTSFRAGQGDYVITFSPAFGSTPTITATPEHVSGSAVVMAMTDVVTTTTANIVIMNASSNLSDREFNFIAVALR